MFLNINFYREGLVALRPTPKLEDHPSSAVRDCLFNLFAAALLIGGHSSIRCNHKLHIFIIFVVQLFSNWRKLHSCSTRNIGIFSYMQKSCSASSPPTETNRLAELHTHIFLQKCVRSFSTSSNKNV